MTTSGLSSSPVSSVRQTATWRQARAVLFSVCRLDAFKLTVTEGYRLSVREDFDSGVGCRKHLLEPEVELFTETKRDTALMSQKPKGVYSCIQSVQI